MTPADTGASTVVDAASAASDSLASSDSRMAPGGPGYRRMSFALFLAGVATFALLYSTQALLPLISGDLGVTASDASWTVAAATGGLAVFV
ncbi:MFS transporter, partial [Streptomyces sp. SID5926]|nr:MFS transporter [Streptomyces sp. SID5926]